MLIVDYAIRNIGIYFCSLSTIKDANMNYFCHTKFNAHNLKLSLQQRL